MENGILLVVWAIAFVGALRFSFGEIGNWHLPGVWLLIVRSLTAGGAICALIDQQAAKLTSVVLFSVATLMGVFILVLTYGQDGRSSKRRNVRDK